jgi:cytochrome c-type biogenesis protein CcmE
MTEAAWEKSRTSGSLLTQTNSGRWKFLVGGLLLLVAVGYLIASGMIAGGSYYLTVDELLADPSYVGKPVRIAGAVIGDTIQYDSPNLILDFTIANVPTDYTNLADALHQAVTNPNAQHLRVHIENEVKPDLLQHEAQAILTGKLGADGVFYATELNLKCPSRFEEAQPGQEISHPSA